MAWSQLVGAPEHSSWERALSPRPGPALAVLVATTLTLLMIPGWLVEASGANLGLSNPVGDHRLAILWGLVLGLCLLLPRGRFRAERGTLVLLWSAKLLVALGIMLLFEATYVPDSVYYRALALSPSVPEAGIGHGTQNVAAILWIHARTISTSHHVMKTTFAFAGIAGGYVFYRAFRPGGRSIRYLWLLTAYPSVLFWSAFLGKEPLILLATAVYCYGATRWLRDWRWPMMALATVGTVAAGLIRPWMGPLLLAPLILSSLPQLRRLGIRVRLALASAAILAGIAGVFVGQTLLSAAPDGTLLSTLEYYAHIGERGGSARSVPPFGSWWDVALFLPRGAFAALFRPLPGEILSPFGWMAGVDALGLLGVAAYTIAHLRGRNRTDPIVVWGLTLLTLWALVYGIISYQNLGTAARYRLPITPILLGLAAHVHATRGGEEIAAKRPSTTVDSR